MVGYWVGLLIVFDVFLIKINWIINGRCSYIVPSTSLNEFTSCIFELDFFFLG